MADSAVIEKGEQTHNKKSCVQEGFLPVPLASVPPDSLNGLEVYISTSPSYSLYKSSDLKFCAKDYERLINAGTEYVYIATKDHQKYYNAIEDSLSDIVKDKTIALNKKCEILYATTIALTKELSSAPIEAKNINKAVKHTESTISLVLKNPKAFHHLFNISNHDFYTATHVSNVSIMLVTFAHKIGVNDTQILNDLGTGGLLHDVGKVFVPQELLNCTEKLTQEEFEIIKSHVKKGVIYLEENADLSEISLKLVAEHHEKMDGSGYPYGLEGENISPQGRLIAAVDMFEAMTSVRPYRDSGIPTEQAMEMIRNMAPEQLDEKIVCSFMQFVENSISGNDTQQSEQSDFQVLAALGIMEGGIKNPSGRRHERYFFRVKSTIRTVFHQNNTIYYGPEHNIIMHNISQSGIGILSYRKFDEGQFINIGIKIPGKDSEEHYFAKVVRIIDHADGWYTLGAEFVKMKSAEQIMDIYTQLK